MAQQKRRHMYKDDSSLDKPANHEAKIWRYMDLWKLLDMVVTSSLHFTRVDRLDDKHEGSWEPSGVFDAYKSCGEDYVNQLKYWERVARTIGAVNCWHVSESEANDMWELYTSGDNGVVIQSTYRALLCEMQEINNRVCTIGLMKYIDHKKDKFEGVGQGGFGTFLDWFVYKDKTFTHENELRVLLLAMGDKDKPAERIPIEGAKLQVKLGRLIKSIRLRPNSQNWKRDLLRKLFADYEIKAEVLPSSLQD